MAAGQVKVFISYSTGDGLVLARLVAEVCRRNEFDPWVWHDNRRSGAYTFSEIAAGIRDCDGVFFLCTASTAESLGQRFEINTALAYPKAIYVIALDRRFVPPELVAFNQNVASEATFEADCQELIDEIEKGFPTWPRYES